MPSPNIWIAASDNDSAAVFDFLSRDASAVNSQDENGYTPIHAAASYNHLLLLKTLIQNHGGNPNVVDHDGETPLYMVETVETARCLVEELGADVGHKNESGLTAADVIEEDGQFPLVAAYLREKMGGSSAAATTTANGDIPTPPEGLDVRVTAVEDVVEDAAGSVDPELRRRIEELAAREDFNSPETQEELRRLVMGAVGGYLDKNEEQERNVRPRE